MFEFMHCIAHILNYALYDAYIYFPKLPYTYRIAVFFAPFSIPVKIMQNDL